ncbi:MAG: pinensin family lanthipeptide [Cyclobacteriaceae bacterium]
MKKQKLAKLRVSSFVTDLDKDFAETIKGGSDWSLVACEGSFSLALCPAPITRQEN